MSLLAPVLPSNDGHPIKWGKLYGAAPALAIAEAAPKAPGPLIVIAQNSREAETLSEEVRFFAGPALNVRVFPDLETLPYDSFSAHPDITSARLATLAELPRARHGVWLVAIDTLLQRLAPRSYIEGYSLKVQLNETLDLEALRVQLAEDGWHAECGTRAAKQAERGAARDAVLALRCGTGHGLALRWGPGCPSSRSDLFLHRAYTVALREAKCELTRF